MKNILKICLLNLFGFINYAFAQNPVVHTKVHFGGQSQMLGVGDYRAVDLTVGDKAIASISLPKGFKIIIFDKDNFQGESLEVSISLANLDFWSNRISSLRVIEVQKQSVKPIHPQVATKSGMEKSQIKKADNKKVNVTQNTQENQVKEYDNQEVIANTKIKKNQQNTKTNTTDKQIIDNAPKGNQAWWDTQKPSGNYSSDDIVIFAGKNFQGQGQILTEGKFDEVDIALGKNNINSIKVPQGYTVRLFENTGFEGDFVDLKAEVSNLASMNWANKISSMRVFKGNAPTENVVTDEDWYNNHEADQVIAYQYADFEGKTNVMTSGNYPSLDKMPVRNYDISSIRVPAGWNVRLYSREDYAGTFVDINEDASNLGKIGWDNRAMSARVSRQKTSQNTDNQEIIIASLPNNNTENIPNTNRNPNQNPTPSNQSIFSNWNRTYRMRHLGTNFSIRIINDSRRENSQIQTQGGNNNWTLMRVVLADNQRGVYRIRDNNNNEFEISLEGNGNALSLNDGRQTWTYWAE